MKKKIYWWLLQLDKIGGTEMVSIDLANHLVDTYDITIIVSASINNCVYHIDKRIKVISLDIPNDIATIDQALNYYKQKKKYGTLLKTLWKAFFLFAFQRNKYRKLVQNKIIQDDALLICSAFDSYWLAPKKGRVYFHFHFNSRGYFTTSNKFCMTFSRKPDKMIFLSKATLDTVINKYPKLATKSVYIHNPIRLEKQLNLDYHHNSILFLARFTEQKNPLLALAIADELKRRHFPFQLTMAGHGSLQMKMEQFINEHNLNDEVKIIGEVHDVPSLLKQQDLLLLTSRFEGFVLVRGEANAMSVPYISSNWGDAVYEVYEEGKNGYVIDSLDPKLYADKIIEVLSDLDNLKQLKLNSYYESDKLSYSNIIPQWKKLL